MSGRRRRIAPRDEVNNERNVCYRQIADIAQAGGNVCFWTKGDIASRANTVYHYAVTPPFKRAVR